MQPAWPIARAFTAALVDASLPVPSGLSAWNGSDVSVRFAVYRNNVVHSLVTVLADTFPVVRQLVGEAFFGAMARLFVGDRPPCSPLMHRYGETFPAWIADFEPATRLPYLPDVARLEFARLTALHAADARPVDAAALANLLQDPERVAATTLILDPSLAIVRSAHPVVSLWSAHQFDEAPRDAQLAQVDLEAGESAMVFRVDDDPLVLELPDPEAQLASDIAEGTSLGEALTANPRADLTQLLSVLLQHSLVVGVLPFHRLPKTPAEASS